jgi:drug/metabolite transporter (DMT)-like permease
MTFVWIKQALNAAELVLGESADLRPVTVLFVTVRFAVAAALLPLILKQTRKALWSPEIWRGGWILGSLLFGGFLFQMIGLESVSPAVSAFLTSLYVLFTALLGVLLGQHRLTKVAMSGVLLATLGAGLISGPPQLNFDWPELITVGSAFIFACQILATHRVTTRLDPLQVSLTSLLVVTFLATMTMILVISRSETPLQLLLEVFMTPAFLRPLLYCAILGSLVAIVALNFSQRYISPVRAAILYGLEPLWTLLFSIGFGLDVFGVWLWIGGAGVILGNLVVEVAQHRKGNAG